MRPVYATRLVVLPGAAQNGETAFEQLVSMAHRWMLGEVGPREGEARPWAIMPVTAPDETYRIESADRSCRFEIASFASGHERGWRGTIVHPYRPPQSLRTDLQRRTEIQLRLDGTETVVTLRRLVGATTDTVAPFSYQAQPPALVHDVIGSCNAWVGNVDVRPWEVDIARVPALGLMLTRHERQAPVLVISQSPAGGPLLEPALAARELAGLAKVVHLATIATASHLAAHLGDAHPVAGGAVRLFWPGYSVADPEAHHPLIVPEALREDGGAGAALHALRQQLCEQAVWAYGSDRRVWEIERAAAEAHVAERDATLGAAFDELARAGEREVWQIRELWLRDRDAHGGERAAALAREENAYAEIARLEAEAVEKKADADALIDDVDKENAALLKRIEALEERPEVVAGSGAAVSLEAIDGMKTVADVLAVVALDVDDDAIVFLPEAYTAARKSPFNGDMLDVFRHLRCLCRVAERYHRHTDGAFNFTGAFRDVGIPESQYRSFTDEQTYNMHLNEYTRMYDAGDGKGARVVKLGPHLTLGIRTNTLVRTYWHVDSENRRLVVGHVGRHLSVFSQGRSRGRT
ncbi:MAG: hypothetical protein QM692_18720 [Thermomicrobiales bacterium]